MTEPHNYDNIVMWAAYCLAFLRSGEITVPTMAAFNLEQHLTPKDLVVDDLAHPTVLQVKIKSSKTDQPRIGIDLYIGATNCDLCPVAVMLSFLVVRGFDPGPLFKMQVLMRARLVKSLKTTLMQAGVDCGRYSSHSFRIGAATTAAARGVAEPTLQMLGRLSSDTLHMVPKQWQI